MGYILTEIMGLDPSRPLYKWGIWSLDNLNNLTNVPGLDPEDSLKSKDSCKNDYF